MKLFKTFGCLMLAGVLTMPVSAAEKDSKIVEEVKKSAEERQQKQIARWLKIAEFHMKRGNYETASFMLSKVFDYEPDNKKAKELKKVNKKYLYAKNKRDARDKYRSFRGSSIKETIRRLEDNGGIMSELRRTHMNPSGPKPSDVAVALQAGDKKVSDKKTDKVNDWAQPILESLKKKYSFTQNGDGQQLTSKISDLLNVSVVVDASLRETTLFTQKFDIKYKNMSGQSVLNNLARELGAKWYLENEALVFSKTLPQARAQTDRVSTYRERQDFPRVDFGDLGLKRANPGPGAGEWNNPYTIQPGYQVVSPNGSVSGGNYYGVQGTYSYGTVMGLGSTAVASTYRQYYGFPRVDFGDLGLKRANPGPGVGEWNHPWIIQPGYQVVNPHTGQVTGGAGLGAVYGSYGNYGVGLTRTVLTADGKILLVLPNGQILSTVGMGGNGFLR